MAEGDRPVEGEIDDRREDEARRPGEFRRQAEVFGAEVGDACIDKIADEADRREGGNLLGDAPARWGGRLDDIHGSSRANWVSERVCASALKPLPQASARTAS